MILFINSYLCWSWFNFQWIKIHSFVISLFLGDLDMRFACKNGKWKEFSKTVKLFIIQMIALSLLQLLPNCKVFAWILSGYKYVRVQERVRISNSYICVHGYVRTYWTDVFTQRTKSGFHWLPVVTVPVFSAGFLRWPSQNLLLHSTSVRDFMCNAVFFLPVLAKTCFVFVENMGN